MLHFGLVMLWMILLSQMTVQLEYAVLLLCHVKAWLGHVVGCFCLVVSCIVLGLVALLCSFKCSVVSVNIRLIRKSP